MEDELEDEWDYLNTVKVGAIYAVKSNSDNAEDGFLLAKCLKVNEASMQANYMEKCAGGKSDEQFYRETKEQITVELERVHTGLVTIFPINDRRVFSVGRCELEDIIFSINC